MLHILKTALGDNLVRDLASKPTLPTDSSESIFGVPLSEASDNVRANVLEAVHSSEYAMVSVSSYDSPGSWKHLRIG